MASGKWAGRFERVRDEYRRDDGSRWGGAAIERATAGKVSRNYVSKLKSGDIDDPSFEKIHLISRAMGVSLDVWLGTHNEVVPFAGERKRSELTGK